MRFDPNSLVAAILLAASPLAVGGCAAGRNDPFDARHPTAALEPVAAPRLAAEPNALPGTFEASPPAPAMVHAVGHPGRLDHAVGLFERLGHTRGAPIQTVALQQPTETPEPLPRPQQFDPIPKQPNEAPFGATPITTITPAVPDSARSLEDLEQLALANNPSVARARADIEALWGRWAQVGLPANPRLGYSGEEMGDAGTAGKQGAFAAQRFVPKHKRMLRREVVAREIDQATQRLAAQQTRVRTDVRLAYYRVLVVQQRVVVTRQLNALAEQTVQTIRRLLDAMQSTRIDLLQAEVEAETASIRLHDATNDHRAALRRLAAVVGVTDLRQIPIHGDLSAPPRVTDWDAAVARLLHNSPQRASAMLGVDRAEWELARAQAEVTPDVDVSVGVQKDNATDETISNVEVELPLPLLDRNQGNIRRARAEIVSARRDAERLNLDLQSRLAEIYRRLTNSQLRVERYRTSLLPKAEETLRLVTKGYQAGEIPYLTLLTAQRTFYRTNLEYLDALDQAWQAHTLVEGLLLSDSLSAL